MIGGMEGVIVAYHNTTRLFGFQYIPLEEIEERIFGGAGRGQRIFDKCVQILEQVLEEAVSAYPDKVSFI
jgi:hypothetical protein